MTFHKLDEKVSETVLDQFLHHAKHLDSVMIGGKIDLPEADKLNVVDLASKIIEVQEEASISMLTL